MMKIKKLKFLASYFAYGPRDQRILITESKQKFELLTPKTKNLIFRKSQCVSQQKIITDRKNRKDKKKLGAK